MELQNTTLDDVSAVIGFSATSRLSAWFGGGTANLYVPETVEEGQLLVKLIGMSAAKALSKEWGHQHLAIPRLTQYEIDILKHQIGQMFERSFSSREIARHLRMSERRVQQICRELEAAGLIDIVTPKKIARNSLPKKAGGKIGPEKGPAHLPPGFFGSAKVPKGSKE